MNKKTEKTCDTHQQIYHMTDTFLPSLKDVMALPVLQGCKIHGGNRTLSQTVRGVNIAEVPDYEKWIKEGEILVSTCYAISRNAGAIRRFIPALAKRKLAAAFIKPSRFLGKMPDVMINAAKTHRFALIELPDDVRFADITKAVSDEIMQRQHALLHKCLSVNDVLTRTITAGADLNEIASVIADVTGSSIWIADTINGRNAVHLMDTHKKLFTGKDGNPLLNKMEKEGQETEIYFEQELYGRLYLFAAEKGKPAPRSQLLEQIVRAIPLEISRYRALREQDERNFNEFFLHLVSDKILDETAELERANDLSFRLSGYHLLLECSMRDLKQTAEYTSLFHRDSFLYALRKQFREAGIPFRMLEAGNRLRVLCTLPEGEGNRCEKLSETVKRLTERLFRTRKELCIYAGCSRFHSGLSGLRACAKESAQALRSAMEHNSSVFIMFDDLGLMRLLYASHPYEEAQRYVRETLRDLAVAKNEKDEALLETLDMFFECQGNQRRMAEELFLHYNTVAYRLRRIQEVTGLNLSERQSRQRAELALQLLHAL